MTLAAIIAENEDALICDLAETYGIYDYRAFPVNLIATLTDGLRSDARIRQAGENYSVDTILRAITADRLGLLVWMQTKDAKTGSRRPQSITEALTRKKEEGARFESIKDFEAARRSILERSRRT